MLNKEQIYEDACNRLRDIVTAINKADNEELTALCVSSLYSGDKDMPRIPDITPTLDKELHFNYKGYSFAMAALVGRGCINKQEMIDAVDNWRNDVNDYTPFYDIYICMISMYNAQEEMDEWYLIPGYLYGATDDLHEGAEVDALILDRINKFLEERYGK